MKLLLALDKLAKLLVLKWAKGLFIQIALLAMFLLYTLI